MIIFFPLTKVLPHNMANLNIWHCESLVIQATHIEVISNFLLSIICFTEPVDEPISSTWKTRLESGHFSEVHSHQF